MNYKKLLPIALAGLGLLIGCGNNSAKKLPTPQNVILDIDKGSVKFDTVEGGEYYQVTILRRINQNTYNSLKTNQRTKDMVCDYEVEKGVTWYFWNENITSLSMLKDKRNNGYIEKSFSLRTYSNTAQTAGDPIEFKDLAVGDHALLVIANETETMAASDPAILTFTHGGTLKEPSGFTFSLNAEKKLEVHAGNYFYTALTSSGLPQKMVYEIKDGETVVETIEVDDFSWVNSIQGPTNAFNFNNANAAGSKVFNDLTEDAAKTYTLSVKAVGDGDKVADATSTGSYGQASQGGNQGGGQGGPGGGGQGGGGGGGFNTSLAGTGSFDVTNLDAVIEFRISFNFALHAVDNGDGSWTLSGNDSLDGGAGGISLTITLNADGTLNAVANGGPMQNVTASGSWTKEGNVITFTVEGGSSSGGNTGGNENPGGDNENPGGGNENPGGGSTDSAWAVNPTTYTWDTKEASFEMKVGEVDYLTFVCTKKDTPNAGSTYSFDLVSKDSGAPFNAEPSLELKSDNTALFHLTAVGPVAETNAQGTWSIAGDIVTITFAE